MSGAFEAKYDGNCAAICGWPIQKGERVTYVDDQLVHADCSRDSSVSALKAAICASCWLTKPCECDS